MIILILEKIINMVIKIKHCFLSKVILIYIVEILMKFWNKICILVLAFIHQILSWANAIASSKVEGCPNFTRHEIL